MKKTLFIIGGITTVAILFAIWLYLLIYGTPKPVAEVFTNFNLFGTQTEPVQTTSEITPATPETVDVATEKLRQLTVRPVIGFREFYDTSSKMRTMLYAEAGTGHIYQINLTTGEEIRVSNTTIPNAEYATFSPDQTYVAIRSGYQTKNEVVLIELNQSGSGLVTTLEPAMTDFSFSAKNELLFTELTTAGTDGRSLNPKTKATQTIFTIPFQAVTMAWSTDGITPHYAYPKATSRLFGYLYVIKNGVVVRQPVTGLGLTAKANINYITYTTLIGSEPISSIYDLTTKKTALSPIVTEPNKCTFSSKATSTLYCGYAIAEYSTNFPDDWYRGTISFADRLWQINLNNRTAKQLIDPTAAVGRSVDTTSMTMGADSKMLYFINKNDTTLWMYEI